MRQAQLKVLCHFDSLLPLEPAPSVRIPPPLPPKHVHVLNPLPMTPPTLEVVFPRRLAFANTHAHKSSSALGHARTNMLQRK